MTSLNKFEITSYFFVWTVGVMYSIYKVYLIGNSFIQNAYYDDFSSGWPITLRIKDTSDAEWSSMFPFLCTLLPWFCIHVLLQEIIRWWCKQYILSAYFVMTSICIIYFFGLSVLLMMIAQPVIFYVILQMRSKSLIWLSCIVFLYVLNMHPVVMLKEVHQLTEKPQYLITVTLSWIHLRCISYCLEKLRMERFNRGHWKEELSELLAYVFYLPLLFFGPIMLYKDFHLGVSRPYKKLDRQLLTSFLFNIIRFCLWAVFNELSLHYIYSSALTFQPDVVNGMDSWALFGFGYCMGQFFMNKYTVLYGIPATFARLERYDAPPHPKCIGRIHLYSDMWKHFDVGLYSFLVRYIFIPACGNSRCFSRKLFASFLCFAFVYIWHGTALFILVWATMNFVVISIERGVQNASQYPAYQQWERKWLSNGWSQRFHAVLASPLLMMSALSNFYFFGGMKIGNIFIWKIFEGWNGSTIVVLAFLYCCCHLSIEVKDWERRKTVKTC